MISAWRRIRIGAFILIGVFVSAVLGYRFAAGYDWVDAIWMVVITISTVGHAEESTFTPGMQIFTVAVILFGMTASVYTFSGFFQLVLEGELDRILGSRRMTRELGQLTDHVIVCGYGRMGKRLVEDLRKEDLPLVVIDSDPNAVSEAVAEGILCVLGDATDETLLESVGIRQAKTLVASLPSDADSVFITLTARDLNPTLLIVARAEQQTTEKKLRQAGANRVVMPTIVGAKQMVRMITRPGTAHLIDLVTESSFQDLELDEVAVREGSALVGSKLADARPLQEHDLLVVAIQRLDKDLIMNPKGDERFHAQDTIMLMGHPNNILNFRRQVE